MLMRRLTGQNIIEIELREIEPYLLEGARISSHHRSCRHVLWEYPVCATLKIGSLG